jgi:hypothetical protein
MFKKLTKAMAPMVAKAAAKAAPSSAPTGGSGRGFIGKVQQAVQQVRPALQQAAPAIKKNLEENPAKAVVGGVKGIGKQVARGIRRMGFKEGGSVSSGRGNGIAVRGKTKCKMS